MIERNKLDRFREEFLSDPKVVVNREFGEGKFCVIQIALAMADLRTDDRWPEKLTILAGPTGSGKTTLIRSWREQGSLVALDGHQPPHGADEISSGELVVSYNFLWHPVRYGVGTEHLAELIAKAERARILTVRTQSDRLASQVMTGKLRNAHSSTWTQRLRAWVFAKLPDRTLLHLARQGWLYRFLSRAASLGFGRGLYHHLDVLRLCTQPQDLDRAYRRWTMRATGLGASYQELSPDELAEWSQLPW